MADPSNRNAKGAELLNTLFGRVPDIRGVDGDLLNVARDHVFGEIWAREGFAIKNRSLITVAALVSLGQPQELKVHLGGALRMGWTADELREAIIHLGYYVGFPRAVTAMGVLEDVLEEAGRSS